VDNSTDQSRDQISVTTETAPGRRTLRVVCVLVVIMGILGLLSAALFAIVPEALPFRANWERLLVTSNAELSLLALMYGVLPLFALAAYVGVRQYRRSWRIRKPAVLPD
jgi:hypothetical protein